MTDVDKYFEKQLESPEFRREWDALQPERAILAALVEARETSGMTQKELALRAGIHQGDISKLERGNTNPSLKTLRKFADALGKNLRIEFVPR
jgi:DNA-binding XRE family transcriptional regulator